MAVIFDPEELETAALQEFIGDGERLRVLEIGAGDGRVTWRYADRVAHITALEPDVCHYEEALENLPASLRDKVSFIHASLEDFNPPPLVAGFNLVILSWVL